MAGLSELTDAGASALGTITHAPAAWCWETEVPAGAFRRQVNAMVRPWTSAAAVRSWLAGLGTAGHGPDVLASLHSGGWLVPWPWPQRGAVPAWTLTPLAAEALGVAIAERWGYERVPDLEYRGPRREPAKVWRRAFSEEPIWREPATDEHGANLYPPVKIPIGERLGLGLAGWEGEPGGATPEQEAEMAEAVRLLEKFEADPVRNFGCLEQAEAIVEGFTACVRERWKFDPATGRPVVLFGQLVPVDRRIGGQGGRPPVHRRAG